MHGLADLSSVKFQIQVPFLGAFHLIDNTTFKHIIYLFCSELIGSMHLEGLCITELLTFSQWKERWYHLSPGDQNRSTFSSVPGMLSFQNEQWSHSCHSENQHVSTGILLEVMHTSDLFQVNQAITVWRNFNTNQSAVQPEKPLAPAYLINATFRIAGMQPSAGLSEMAKVVIFFTF